MSENSFSIGLRRGNPLIFFLLNLFIEVFYYDDDDVAIFQHTSTHMRSYMKQNIKILLPEDVMGEN